MWRAATRWAPLSRHGALLFGTSRPIKTRSEGSNSAILKTRIGTVR